MLSDSDEDHDNRDNFTKKRSDNKTQFDNVMLTPAVAIATVAAPVSPVVEAPMGMEFTAVTSEGSFNMDFYAISDSDDEAQAGVGEGVGVDNNIARQDSIDWQAMANLSDSD